MPTDPALPTAFIVDDEPIARAGLRRMLEEVEWLRIVGEADTAEAALPAIESRRPDIVFLDVQMPGILGTELPARLQHRPLFVFTTAYAQHAVTAFELGAVDYLLKPFGSERLQATLDRLRAALGEPAAPAFERLADAWGQGSIERLFVRTGRSIVPVAIAEVRRFEAVGDYVAVHAGAEPFLLHLSLARLEERVDARRFLRIHRAHLVNLDRVRHFRRFPDGRMVAEMQDGESLPVSRERAKSLRRVAR